MRNGLRWTLIAGLAVVYLLALLAVLHPRMSEAYRAYFVERTSTEWNPQHYRGTPEQGIVFAEKGLPDWVAWTYGLTAREPRGRWTDDDLGNVAGMVFDRPWNGTFCVEFSASPAQPMRGSFEVRLGSQSKTVPLTSSGFADYQAQFTDVRDAQQLAFVLPKNLPRVHEYDPPNGDPRRLGLLLARLKVRSGNCTPPR